MTRTLIIFANSVKHHQHCVAGKDIFTKEWIRPVDDKNGCALRDEQTKYQNNYGKFLVKPLQKMQIEFLEKSPLLQQPENYIISNKIWTQQYKINREEIEPFLDTPNDLWLDGISYTDRVNCQLIQNNKIQITQSLYLIKVDVCQINKLERRAIFNYKNITYNLAVTDPNIQYTNIDQKYYYLVISLGENFKGYCYKLVASIL